MSSAGGSVKLREEENKEEHISLVDRQASCFDLFCPSFLSCCLASFSGMFLCGCQMVRQKSAFVVLNFGKYYATLAEPGCYCCINPCGMEFKDITLAIKTEHIEKVKIADANGNPLLISAVVTYRVISPVKAVLDVPDYVNYVENQALTVMKRVASMYPYEAKPGQNSLKSEAEHVREMMVSFLQEKASLAGIEIISFDLSDLSYAPEIAQGMLVRQQAQATLDARSIIAKGAVGIATETIRDMESQGVKLTEAGKNKLVSNLVVTICGDSKNVAKQ